MPLAVSGSPSATVLPRTLQLSGRNGDARSRGGMGLVLDEWELRSVMPSSES